MGLIENPGNSLSKDQGFVGASIDLDRPADVTLIKKVIIAYNDTVLNARGNFEEEYKEFFPQSKNQNLLQITETLKNTLIRNNNEKAIKLEVLTKAIPIAETLRYKLIGESINGQDFVRTGVYLGSDGALISSSLEANFELIVNTKYLHIYVLPAIDITRENFIVTSSNNKTLGLADIVDLSVSIGVSTFSTASFSLKNDLNKYEFVTNPLKKGRTIFSADDIIVVRLPSIDYQMTNKNLYEGLETSFVGFVNDIRVTDRPTSHTININCEGMTKRLRFSRAITKQALGVDDAQASMMPLSAFSFPFSADVNSASQLVKHLIVNSSLTQINEDTDLKQKVSLFEQFFRKYNSYEDEKFFLSRGAEGYKVLANMREDIQRIKDNKKYRYFLDSKDLDNSNDAKIYNNETSLYPINSGFKIPVCSISGTSQKAYKLIFAQWEMWVAEWTQVNKLIQEMADTINFVFFDSENGMIKFEQINVSLEHLKKKQILNLKKSDSDTIKANKNIDAMKMKNAFFIKEMWIKDRTILDGTSEIVNIITILGAAIQEGIADWNKYGSRATIKNNKLIKKHGPIMGPTISVLNLINSKSCLAYGKALLDRMNKKSASNANLRLVGNASIKAGFYCYIEEKNSLFYIEKVNHSYSVGGNYDTELELSYRREPILKVDNDAVPELLKANEKTNDNTINFEKIKQKLNSDFNDSLPFNSKIRRDLLTKVKKASFDMGYEDSEISSCYTEENLESHYFNGFIWEHTIETDFSKYTNYIFNENTILKNIEIDFSDKNNFKFRC